MNNKGLLYWTKEEKEILSKNMYKSVKVLKKLLPARSECAIYQMKSKVYNKAKKAAMTKHPVKGSSVTHLVQSETKAESIHINIPGGISIVIKNSE